MFNLRCNTSIHFTSVPNVKYRSKRSERQTVLAWSRQSTMRRTKYANVCEKRCLVMLWLSFLRDWYNLATLISARFRYSFFKHIEAEIKLPPVSRQHFQIHFRAWKCMNFDKCFTEVCSQLSNQQYYNIVSDNGLTPCRQQAIIWNNDVSFTDAHMRHSTSIFLNNPNIMGKIIRHQNIQTTRKRESFAYVRMFCIDFVR